MSTTFESKRCSLSARRDGQRRGIWRACRWAFSVLLVGLLTLAAGLFGVASARAGGSGVLRFYGPTLLRGSLGGTEPRVAVAPDGAEYAVSGLSADSSPPSTSASKPVVVYVSKDHGLIWKATPSQPVQVQGSPDVDIVVTHTGRIVVAEDDFAGIGVVVSYSDDGGRTWKISVGGSHLADQDRPWLAVGPYDPSTHQSRVYLLFHNALSGSATENEFVETSTDGGATFGPPVPITLPGTQAFLDLQCGDNSGPSGLVVNQRTGRLYAFWNTRHGPLGGCGMVPPQPATIVASTRVWVATSADNSPGSWTTSLAVDDSATGNIVGMQVAPGALDTAGNVYVTYPESPRPFPDFTGAAVRVRWAPPDLSHWSTPLTIAPAGAAGNVLTHIAVGYPGQLDVAYFAGAKAGAGKSPKWYMTVAHVGNAFAATPTVTRQRLQHIPAYRGTATQLMGWCNDTNPANQVVPACSSSRSSDVWGIALDRRCRVLLTWPTVSRKSNPKVGASVDATWVATQTGGPSLCHTLHHRRHRHHHSRPPHKTRGFTG